MDSDDYGVARAAGGGGFEARTSALMREPRLGAHAFLVLLPLGQKEQIKLIQPGDLRIASAEINQPDTMSGAEYVISSPVPSSPDPRT